MLTINSNRDVYRPNWPKQLESYDSIRYLKAIFVSGEAVQFSKADLELVLAMEPFFLLFLTVPLITLSFLTAKLEPRICSSLISKDISPDSSS